MKPAAVAAALLIASDQLDRHLACEHCKIPEGGARTRVGKLAKYFRDVENLNCWVPMEWLPSQTGSSSWVPELPVQWQAPERTAPVEKKRPKPKRSIDALTSMPEFTSLLAKKYQREETREISALSPQKTRRVHTLQYDSPGGGCTISTYAADATPFEEGKEARTRRLGTNRERRSQAFKTLELNVFVRAHLHDQAAGTLACSP